MATEALTFKIGADTAGLQRGLGSAIKTLGGLSAAFLSVRAVTDSFAAALDMGSRFSDLSDQSGETAGNMSLLARAFQNAGAGADKAGPAIAKMQKFISDASAGSVAANKTLEALGVTTSELAGKLPLEQMSLIAERIGAIQDPTERAAAAMEIFGAKNSKMIGLLRNFSGEMATAKAELGSLPGILDNSAGSMDGFADKLQSIREKTTEISVGFWSELIPAIDELVKKMAGVDAAGFGRSLAGVITNSKQSQLDTINAQIKNKEYLNEGQKSLSEKIFGVKETRPFWDKDLERLKAQRQKLTEEIAQDKANAANEKESADISSLIEKSLAEANKPTTRPDILAEMEKLFGSKAPLASKTITPPEPPDELKDIGADLGKDAREMMEGKWAKDIQDALQIANSSSEEIKENFITAVEETSAAMDGGNPGQPAFDDSRSGRLERRQGRQKATYITSAPYTNTRRDTGRSTPPSIQEMLNGPSAFERLQKSKSPWDELRKRGNHERGHEAMPTAEEQKTRAEAEMPPERRSGTTSEDPTMAAIKQLLDGISQWGSQGVLTTISGNLPQRILS